MIDAREELSVTMRDGAVHRVKRLGSGPPLLFSHGAGFAVDCYAGFVHWLAECFEVFCFDMRGHGRGPAMSPEAYALEDHIADIDDLVHGLHAQGVSDQFSGVFHSVSGVFALAAQAANASLFRHLVLFEPPMAIGGALEATFVEDRSIRAVRAGKRREVFASVEELASRYQAVIRSDEASEVLARALLEGGADGEYRLRCQREIESKTYSCNRDFGVWDVFPAIGCSGTVVAGRPQGVLEYPAEVAPLIAEAGRFDFLVLDDMGHLGPLEAADRVAHAAISSLRFALP